MQERFNKYLEEIKKRELQTEEAKTEETALEVTGATD